MDIRKKFLDYFKKRQHLVLPSSGLIPENDTSVLFTTAGMQPFKPYYLGIEKPPNNRISTVQKCFRTSDIDCVGYTDRHLTFFEMLGNFAFGDYFKKEAIDFAFDFIVNVLKIPQERLLIAVFKGDKEIPADKESIQYWKENGFTDDVIYKFDKKENFWGPAGSTGPCGPCTEIYYDFGKKTGCGKANCNPNCDCGRFLEVWNLVFTQYNFDGKKYLELPEKNIDTGMGLERIIAVMEGESSVFRTSLFKKMLKKIHEVSGKRLTSPGDKDYDPEVNRALRILADHIRAIYFLIAGDVTPSNEGRGYILRRIIRRAVRYGKQIGINDYFINDIGETVTGQYSYYYPELSEKSKFSKKLVLDEEKRFTRTLKEGSKILSEKISEIKKSGKDHLDPKDAFRLYDTYGFPVELTREILDENGLKLDLEKFDEYFKEHTEKSKARTSFDKKIDENLDLYRDLAKEIHVEFLGYEKDQANTYIERIISSGDSENAVIVNELNAGEKGEIVLKDTVFYGEKGGQVGDSGIIKSKGGIFIVKDTQIPVEDLIVHKGFVKEGKIIAGEKAEIEVSNAIRKDIRKNHTSTHLLHWALRNVFGDQLKQAGSFVADDRFRFDYSIYDTPTGEQIDKVEKLINERIQRDEPIHCFETTRDYAQQLGTIALFDEKYGKFVRIVEIGNYSRELCGGLHINRTGQIGLFSIISDTSIGANLRRIEAVTGMHAFNALKAKEDILDSIALDLEVDIKKVPETVKRLKDKNLKISEEFNTLKVKSSAENILKGLENEIGKAKHNIIYYDFSRNSDLSSLDVKSMGQVSDHIKDSLKNSKTFIVFGNIIGEKPVIILSCTKDMVDAGIDCGKLAREIGKIVKGGGGGRPDYAQLGGSEPESLDKAIKYAVNDTRKTLGLK
jgi:alanyl-tRNA synthetase